MKNEPPPCIQSLRTLRHSVAVLLLLGGLALMTCPWWMTPAWLLQWAQAAGGLPSVWTPAHLQDWQVGLARFGVTLPGLSAWMACLRLHAFLKEWAADIDGKAVAAHRLRAAAGWLMLTAFFQTAGTTVAVLTITASNPEGQRVVTVGLEPSQLAVLLLSATVLLLSRYLGWAANAAAENRQFI